MGVAVAWYAVVEDALHLSADARRETVPYFVHNVHNAVKVAVGCKVGAADPAN